MEIESVYKVDGIEFSSKEEASKYIEEKTKEENQKLKEENEKQEELNVIEDLEKTLSCLYESFEQKYGNLPNRSNNIKELLKRI